MTKKVNHEAAPTVEETLAGTEAGKLWDEIKNRPIEMFALPNQYVSQYCQPAVVEPSKLYLLAKPGPVLPALETALGRAYTVEAVNKYITVARAVPSL
jgi:hypothetical protein